MSAAAVAFKNEGNGFFKAKDFNAAIAKYTEGVKVDPSYHVLYSNRSQAYFNLGKYAEAAQDGQLCMNANPKFVKGYHRRANALLQLNKIEECMQTLELAYKNVGRGNADLARIDEIVRPKAEAMREAAKSRLRGPAKYKSMGNDLFKKADYPGAIKMYQKAVSACKSPGSAGFEADQDVYIKCHNNMALCYKQQSDFSKVMECSTAVLELDGWNVKALFNRAGALEGLEKYKHALSDCRKVLLREPNFAAANSMQNRLNRNIRLMEAQKKGR